MSGFLTRAQHEQLRALGLGSPNVLPEAEGEALELPEPTAENAGRGLLGTAGAAVAATPGVVARAVPDVVEGTLAGFGQAGVNMFRRPAFMGASVISRALGADETADRFAAEADTSYQDMLDRTGGTLGIDGNYNYDLVGETAETMAASAPIAVGLGRMLSAVPMAARALAQGGARGVATRAGISATSWAVGDALMSDLEDPSIVQSVAEALGVESEFTRFFSHDDSDGQIERRLKIALEGMLLGLAAEGAVEGAMSLFRVAKRVGRNGEDIETALADEAEAFADLDGLSPEEAADAFTPQTRAAMAERLRATLDALDPQQAGESIDTWIQQKVLEEGWDVGRVEAVSSGLLARSYQAAPPPGQLAMDLQGGSHTPNMLDLMEREALEARSAQRPRGETVAAEPEQLELDRNVLGYDQLTLDLQPPRNPNVLSIEEQEDLIRFLREDPPPSSMPEGQQPIQVEPEPARALEDIPAEELDISDLIASNRRATTEAPSADNWVPEGTPKRMDLRRLQSPRYMFMRQAERGQLVRTVVSELDKHRKLTMANPEAGRLGRRVNLDELDQRAGAALEKTLGTQPHETREFMKNLGNNLGVVRPHQILQSAAILKRSLEYTTVAMRSIVEAMEKGLVAPRFASMAEQESALRETIRSFQELTAEFGEFGSYTGRTLRFFKQDSGAAPEARLEFRAETQVVPPVKPPKDGVSVRPSRKNPKFSTLDEELDRMNGEQLRRVAMRLLAGQGAGEPLNPSLIQRGINIVRHGWAMFETTFIANLMSHPATIAFNTFGSAVGTGAVPLEKISGGLLRAPFNRSGLKTAREGIDQIRGYFNPQMWAEAGTAAVRTLQDGLNRVDGEVDRYSDLSNMATQLRAFASPDMKQAANKVLDNSTPPAERGMALMRLALGALQTPMRASQSVESLFKYMSIGTGLRAKALREAAEQLSGSPMAGKALKQAIQENAAEIYQRNMDIWMDVQALRVLQEKMTDTTLSADERMVLKQREMEVSRRMLTRNATPQGQRQVRDVEGIDENGDLEAEAWGFSTADPILKDAVDEAREGTFTSPLEGTIGREMAGRLGATLRTAPPLKLFVTPFFNTPINIGFWFGDRSPLAPLTQRLWRDIRAGGVTADKAIGRLVTGVTLTGAFYNLFAQGLSTGDGPSNPEQRRVWMEQGFRPNSIRIGDQWIPTQRADPIAAYLRFISNSFEAYDELEAQGPEGANAGLALMIGVSAALSDTYMIEPLTRLLTGMQDPKRLGDAAAQNITGGLTPAALQLFNDDEMLREIRETGDILEEATDRIRSRVPGLSEQLPPNRDAFGRPILRDGQFGSNWGERAVSFALNINAGEVVDDPAVRALHDLGVTRPFPRVQYPGTRINLNASEWRLEGGQTAYDRLEELFGTVRINGKTFYETVSEMVTSSQWERLTPNVRSFAVDINGERRALIDRAREQYKQAAQRELLREIPGLREAVEREVGMRNMMGNNRNVQQLETDLEIEADLSPQQEALGEFIDQAISNQMD